jgi:DNA repair exonuclease SbcCD ATPase subunit
MIPLRVQLKGFLSYKDEQEITFDGAPVWLLAGLNGSGKSTVFDAVTYALFGHHRGGAHDAVELINKDSDRALVEFQFAVDGREYQIVRTLQRTRQGAIRAGQTIGLRNSGGGFDPIEGTSLQKGFKEWIDQHLGLNYETFTSSVLLLQGRAEKLLDSTAKGRFEVLAGIVDLERYERLHKRADEERKALDNRCKNIRQQLDGRPEVSALELLAAENKVTEAEQARAEAQVARERCQQLEFHARQWSELQGKLQATRQRVKRTEVTLQNAAAIEANASRLRELQGALPRLQEIVKERANLHTAAEELAQQHKRRETLDQDVRQLLDDVKRTREQRAVLQQQIQQDERALQRTSAELRTLQLQVEKLNEVDRQEQQRQRLLAELKRLPGDPRETVRKRQQEVQQAQDLQQALAPLARLHGQRAELADAIRHEKTAAAELARVKKHGETLRAEVDRLKPLAEQAADTRRSAEQEATRDCTLVDQARQLRDEFLQTDGAKVCRLCNQPLTPAHWQAEKKRRASELTATETRARTSADALRQAVDAEKAVREQLKTAETQLVAAREMYRTQHHHAEQARRDVERLQRDCALSYQECPLPFKERIAAEPPRDWLATTYPTAEDLDAARQQASTLGALRRALQEATDQLGQWNTLQGQLGTLEQTLQRMRAELPANPAALRETHARQEAQEKVLQSSVAARRKEEDDCHKRIDRLTAEHDRKQQEMAHLKSRVATLETNRQHCQHNQDRLHKELPPAWQDRSDKVTAAEVVSLKAELTDLVAAKSEEQAQELQGAVAGLQVQRQAVLDLEAEAGRIPEEGRIALEEVRRFAEEARKIYQARDEELASARASKQSLEQLHQERDALQRELLGLEEDQTHARLLAELLGRDRLQLHLVRQAERQVVDHANAVLDRLTGGQLYLKLAGHASGEDASTKALELEVHNRHTGERPINVAFLSGSQRFRVAVSLALGIGQYASRQHRPLESVIIDEGFGCLDRFGRQLMIQELQNLRGHVRCILLVSHQDEFAEAFPNGYRFELTNGSTVATRFQK